MEYMAAQMDRHIEACQHWEEERLGAIAWAAYTKAWPEAMAGNEAMAYVNAGFKRIDAMISSMSTAGASDVDIELLELAKRAIEANR